MSNIQEKIERRREDRKDVTAEETVPKPEEAQTTHDIVPYKRADDDQWESGWGGYYHRESYYRQDDDQKWWR